MSKFLRTSLESEKKQTIATEERIYILLPKPMDHLFHPMGRTAGLLQPIDETLVKKIHELVGSGVNCVSEMQRHLHHYVKKELFTGQQPPDLTNRRFFPTTMDVRSHMYPATVVCRHSQIDQENLDLKIKKWKEESPDDNFFFRPYYLTSDSESYQQPQSLKEEDSTDVIKISIGDPF